jgi:hypothetical protein
VAEAGVNDRTASIRQILADLVRQRQTLRAAADGSEARLLEANRRSIVYWQAELSRALLADHGDRDDAAA